MKASRTVLMLLSGALASGACIVVWESGESQAVSEPKAAPASMHSNPVQAFVYHQTNSAGKLRHSPVQALEERADAMLFEIDALQNMPFDQPIIMPIEQSAR